MIKPADWTEKMVKNARVCSAHLLKSFNKVLSFVVMDESTDFLPYVFASHDAAYEKMCVHVCKNKLMIYV